MVISFVSINQSNAPANELTTTISCPSTIATKQSSSFGARPNKRPSSAAKGDYCTGLAFIFVFGFCFFCYVVGLTHRERKRHLGQNPDAQKLSGARACKGGLRITHHKRSKKSMVMRQIGLDGKLGKGPSSLYRAYSCPFYRSPSSHPAGSLETALFLTAHRIALTISRINCPGSTAAQLQC